MEGKLKILGINPKSEEIISFYPIFSFILKTLYSVGDYVKQNCRVLVMILYNLNLACQHIIEGKLKILDTNQKSEEILVFCVFMDFYCNVV